jgi:ATP-dependent DNA helicase RecG
MTDETLNDIILQGEGYYTEFKRSFNSDLKKEIVAFANASGGKILLGIDDDGKIPGISVSNSLLSKIQDAAQGCDPPVYITTKILEQNVILIDVPEGRNKPYRCTKGFYIRVGANAQKLTTESIVEFIEKEGRIRFDEQIRLDVSIDNFFSKTRWENYIQLSEINPRLNPYVVLKSLGAVKSHNNVDYFTNAGVLTFTDKPVRFLPQALVTCVAYNGNTKVNIIDRKEFDENIFSNINAAIAFVKSTGAI